MSSDAAAPTPTATGEQQGSKRAPEKDSSNQDGVDGGPPPAKVAKPGSASADDEDAKLDVKAALKGQDKKDAVEGSRSGPTDSERVEEEALRSVGLAVGSRMEVMWVLEDDDKSVEKVRRGRSFSIREDLIKFLSYSSRYDDRRVRRTTSSKKGRLTFFKNIRRSEVIYIEFSVEHTHSQRRNPAWTSFPVSYY